MPKMAANNFREEVISTISDDYAARQLEVLMLLSPINIYCFITE